MAEASVLIESTGSNGTQHLPLLAPKIQVFGAPVS